MFEATYKVDAVARPAHAVVGHVSLLFSWGDNTRAVALREGQSLVIGRAEPADWIVEDRSLSRTHARVSFRDGCVTLEDLASTNGCMLNGTRCERVTLGEGDLAQLGTVELRVCAQTILQTQMDGLSHAQFMRALAEELTRARLFGRSVSVLALKSTNETARELLQRALKPLDRLCAYAPALHLVLLPEQDAV